MTLRRAPQSIKLEQAPVWVPRNGDYYVITCTDCLRSFSIPAEKNVPRPRELRMLACIFCGVQVQFIVEEMPEAAGLPMIRNGGAASTVHRKKAPSRTKRTGLIAPDEKTTCPS